MTVKRLIKLLQEKCNPEKEIRILQYKELSPKKSGIIWNLHLEDPIGGQEILVLYKPKHWRES